jgi:outer membrane protein assembly factor BamB
MATTTDQLLKQLEQSQLITPETLAEVRARIAKVPGKIDPRSIAKWLVQKRYITLQQGLDLLDGKLPSAAQAAPVPKKAPGEELLLADDLQTVDDDLEVVDDNLEVVDEDLEVVDEELEVVEDLDVVGEEDLITPSAPAPPTPTKSPQKQRTSGAASAPRPATPVQPKPVRKSPPLPTAVPANDVLAESSLGQLYGGLATAELTSPLVGAGSIGLGKKKKKSSAWDSPLLLFGGGTLLALVILAGVLYWAIGRQTGDEALRLAEEDYQSGSYTQAVHKFDQYLENFPTHKGVSTARVHRGLAYMRQVIDGSSDWTKSLEASQQTLAEIAKEKEFPQARSELAALLPKVAGGLAEQARRKPEQKLVDQAAEALAMVEKYVPKSLRPGEELQAVEQSLALTRLQLARDESLDKALAEIEAATVRGEPAEAYSVRKALLKVYPDLEKDASLQKAVLAISQSEKDDVTMVAEPRPAETTEVETPIEASLTLVARTSAATISGPAQTALVLAEGAAYGVEASTGAVAWRRYVGFDTQFVPKLIKRQSQPHALLVDSARGELVCLQADNGKLAWRQSLEESKSAEVLVLRDRLAAATTDGRLRLVDLASGDSSGFVQFPHRLTVAPATDSRERHFYQLADHSNLYVIDAHEGRCQELIYIGHEAGTIRIPPIVVGRYLLIAENGGVNRSTLRVFTAGEDGLGVQLVQNVTLEGHVHVPPLVTQSKTLLVVTDRGTFYTFDIASSDKKEPLTQVASRPSLDDRPLVRFSLARGAEFWIADNQLAKFDIQAAQGRLSPKWQQNRGDIFVQPLETFGEHLIHARRKEGLPGVAVAAARMSDGKIAWEVHLGAPLAGQPLLSGKESAVVAMNQVGGWYRLPDGELETKAIENDPKLQAAPKEAVGSDPQSAMTSLGISAFGLGSGAGQLISVDTTSKSPNLQTLPLPGALSMGPVAVAEHLLVGTRSGQVLLLEASSGQPAIEPFQPPLESDMQITWRLPAILPDGGIVVADDLHRLFRLKRADQPRPHLAVAAEKSLPRPIVTRLASAGDYVYGASEDGELTAYQSSTLEAAGKWKLEAPLTWGPLAAGDQVLAATAGDVLFSATGKHQLWQQPLRYGPLTGPAHLVDGKLMLTCQSGIILLLNPTDGEEIDKVEVGHPLVAALPMDDTLLLVGHDGTLMKIARP